MGLIPFKKKKESLTFEELLESNIDGMYRAALRYTRDAARAEDLVQDTVVRALRYRDHFEMGTNFRAWIHTILNHTFIHGYRRKKREREILDGAKQGDVVRSLRSEATGRSLEQPESWILDNMVSQDVIDALDGLSEDYRVAVTLCDVEGLSYKEIAEVIDKPIGTVMSRLHRGRQALRKKLEHLAIERGIVKEDDDGRSGNDVVDFQKHRRLKRHGT